MRVAGRITVIALAACFWPAACSESSGPAADAPIEDIVHGEDVTADPYQDDAGTEPSSDPGAEDPLPDETAGDVPVEPPAEAIDVPTDVPGCEEGCAGGLCCDGRCVNPAYDPDHCGGCGHPCPTDNPFCNGGSCGPTPCDVVCTGITTCCGTFCCEMDQVCCIVQGPGPVASPTCHDGDCPLGCPMCL
jgi:hypothetical protein